MTGCRLVAVLEEFVLVYSLGSQLELLAVLRSAPNREGLSVLVASSSQCLLAYPITGAQLRSSASQSASAQSSSATTATSQAAARWGRGPDADRPAEGSVRIVDLSRLPPPLGAPTAGSILPLSSASDEDAPREWAAERSDASGDERKQNEALSAMSALERIHVLDVAAHKTSLAALQLSLDAQLLATASSKVQ